MTRKSRITVATVQTAGTPMVAWRETLRAIDAMVAGAADQGAELVVLPECVFPAYVLGSAAAYRTARAQGMPGAAEFEAQCGALAKRHGVYLVAGYVAERDADRTECSARLLWNRAGVFAPGGALLGTYDKAFLWDTDHACFAAGRRIEPIDCEFGTLGVLICADNRMPEIPATLAACGAQLLVQPTCWVNVQPAFDEQGARIPLYNPQPEYMCASRAAECGVALASASKWGREDPTEFVGQSSVFDAHGHRLARSPAADNAIALAEVPLSGDAGAALSFARQTRPFSGVWDRLRDPALTYAPPQLDAEAAATIDARAGAPLLLNGRTIPPPDLAASVPSVAEVNGVGVTVLPADGAFSFGPVRYAALCGALVVVYLGGGVAQAHLRTRAAENRVFVVQHDPAAGVRVYAPSGRRLNPDAPGGREAERFTLSLREALNKEVASQTNPLTDRTPSLYRFR